MLLLVFLIVFITLKQSFTESIIEKFENNAGCLKGKVELADNKLLFVLNSPGKENEKTFILSSLDATLQSVPETKISLNSHPITDDSKLTFQKHPSMLINELAQYNNIEINYNLISEHGLPNQKIFTINLILGKEEYEGIGTSLKKAKQNASAKALKATKYEHPPIKTIENQLRALAEKRSEDVVFSNEFETHAEQSKKYSSQPIYFPTSYVDNETHSAQNKTDDSKVHSSYERSLEEPFMIRLHVGNREYFGMGYSVNAARQDAALKAIEEIKMLDMEEHCVLQNDCKEVSEAVLMSKSPISLVYEIAKRKDMNVEFLTIKEEGPPHSKTFVIRCQVDDLYTDAAGKSKKASKKLAAERMLEKFKKLGWYENSVGKKSNRKAKKKSKNVNKEGVRISTDIPEIIFEKEPTLVKEMERNEKLPTKAMKGIKDILLELAEKLGVSIQFWEVRDNKNEKYLSFLALNIDPPEVCFGNDAVREKSREKAALRALETLEKHGIDNIYTQNVEKEKYRQIPQSFDQNREIADDYIMKRM